MPSSGASPTNVVLAGLKGSGKSTYLAALWHLLEEGDLPSALILDALQPDRRYLNKLRDTWLAAEPLQRTSLRDEQHLLLRIRDTASRRPVDLSVPDLSGESFRLQWNLRRVTNPYAQHLKDCAGVLLFIHPASALPVFRIPPRMPPRDESASEAGRSWTSDLAPTQVQLVELLQIAQRLRASGEQLRVSVVISAWDTVAEQTMPSAWLTNSMPLLWQFLHANANHQPFQMFGVSAQGGDIQTAKDALLQTSMPAKRVRIVDTTLEPHHDLAAPLRFVLGFD